MPANQSTARTLNKREIIETLVTQGEMCRSDLAKALGLSKPAVAGNIVELIDMGLVNEVGEGSPTEKGGRKPRMLAFNYLYRYLVGIDLSRRYPVVAVSDLSGRLLGRVRVRAAVPDEEEGRLKLLGDAISQILARLEADPTEIGVICVAAPGLYDTPTGTIRSNPQFRQWTGLALREYLERAFTVPVVIKNDMNAAALAESVLGGGSRHSNLVYVSCGAGLGAGLILDGKIYEGSNRGAGEIAFFTNSGLFSRGISLEQATSIGGLLGRIREDLLRGAASNRYLAFADEPESLSFEDVVAAYRAKDAYTIRQIRTVGSELGFAFANIATLLDVELIVLGGEYLVFYEELQEQILAIAGQCTVSPLKMIAARLGEEAALHGALLAAKSILFAGLDL